MTALSSQIPETLFRRDGLTRVQRALQAHGQVTELMTDRRRELLTGAQAELNSLLQHALSLSVARRWAELAECLHQCMFVTTDDLGWRRCMTPPRRRRRSRIRRVRC
jgi:xanthine/CO dehydrogenase XdhC/CoxF family maturation factor